MNATGLTQKQRLKLFVKSLGITQTEFCKVCNIKPSDLSSNNDKNFGKVKLSRIYTAYPNLNSLWVEHGVGDMLGDRRESQEMSALIEYVNYTNSLLRDMTRMQNEIRAAQKHIIQLLQEKY